MKFGKKIHEIDLFDFTSFFGPGHFLIFWPTVNQICKQTAGRRNVNKNYLTAAIFSAL